MQTKRRCRERGEPSCGRPLPARNPSAGRAGGWSALAPDSPPTCPPPRERHPRLRPDPRACSEDPSAPQALSPRSPRAGCSGRQGVAGCGVQAGHARTLAHPEQTAIGLRPWGTRLPGPAPLPPPAEREGGGAAAGKSDPTTSASVQARPKLSVGGGGAGGGSGAWRGSRPRAGRTDSTGVPRAPRPARARGPGAAGAARPDRPREDLAPGCRPPRPRRCPLRPAAPAQAR